jgi:hypothetical protein
MFIRAKRILKYDKIPIFFIIYFFNFFLKLKGRIKFLDILQLYINTQNEKILSK